MAHLLTAHLQLVRPLPEHPLTAPVNLPSELWLVVEAWMASGPWLVPETWMVSWPWRAPGPAFWLPVEVEVGTEVSSCHLYRECR